MSASLSIKIKERPKMCNKLMSILTYSRVQLSIVADARSRVAVLARLAARE